MIKNPYLELIKHVTCLATPRSPLLYPQYFETLDNRRSVDPPRDRQDYIHETLRLEAEGKAGSHSRLRSVTEMQVLSPLNPTLSHDFISRCFINE